MRQPSEKVRQAVHEWEETVQRHNAKAQKDHERHRCRLLAEEGSKNEDEDNSDEGRDMEEDNVDEEGGGTQVGLPSVFLCATLTKYHVQFTSQTIPTKLSALWVKVKYWVSSTTQTQHQKTKRE